MTEPKVQKTSEKGLIQPLTKRESTQGRTLKLPTAVKRYAATILSKSHRRHYLNNMLDITRCNIDRAQMKRKDRQETAE
jgi:hypothetical protein